VGPGTSLEEVEKRKILPLPGIELRLLGPAARSQSLYRVSYPGPHFRMYSCLFRGLYNDAVSRSSHCLASNGRMNDDSRRSGSGLDII
jgi:hypothetical protein